MNVNSALEVIKLIIIIIIIIIIVIIIIIIGRQVLFVLNN